MVGPPRGENERYLLGCALRSKVTEILCHHQSRLPGTRQAPEAIVVTSFITSHLIRKKKATHKKSGNTSLPQMASLSCLKPVPDVSGKKKKRYYMKLSMIFRKLLPGLALLLATAAFAANTGSFNAYEPITVSGHQLAPGEYQLKWDGAGPSVDVSLLSRGKLVATVPARLLE